MVVALYPGSFDPVTNGHIDVITRAVALFDKLYIGIFDRPNKNLMFSAPERLELMHDAVVHLPNVEVSTYSCLTINFAHKIGAKALVRGLRISSDFEQEFEMTLMNKSLDPDIETVCLMTSAEHQFIRSSTLKDVVRLGGDIEKFVPHHVSEAVIKKLSLPR
ncbi:MAG: pantetheine-phosphate adenylyltransferase [Dehalococcoidia bacterium]|nr:pantetheine-phosphate adenylyltransferase [Dehalococcoidia bacterium]